MEKTEIFQYLSIYLLSIVKLVLGSVPLSMVYIKMNHLSVVACLTLCCLGGFSGTIVFTRLGNNLWIWLETFGWYRSYQANSKKASIASRRRLINIKNKYGLAGIAFLSPILLSIPGGCILASRFFKNRTSIYIHMFVSIIIWVWGSGLALYFLVN